MGINLCLVVNSLFEFMLSTYYQANTASHVSVYCLAKRRNPLRKIFCMICKIQPIFSPVLKCDFFFCWFLNRKGSSTSKSLLSPEDLVLFAARAESFVLSWLGCFLLCGEVGFKAHERSIATALLVQAAGCMFWIDVSLQTTNPTQLLPVKTSAKCQATLPIMFFSFVSYTLS